MLFRATSCTLGLAYHSKAELAISQLKPENQQPRVAADSDREAPSPEAPQTHSGTKRRGSQGRARENTASNSSLGSVPDHLRTLGQSLSPPELHRTFSGALPSANGLRWGWPPSWGRGGGGGCWKHSFWVASVRERPSLAVTPVAFCPGPLKAPGRYFKVSQFLTFSVFLLAQCVGYIWNNHHGMSLNSTSSSAHAGEVKRSVERVLSLKIP